MKRIIIFSFILVSILMIGTVSAADNVTGDSIALEEDLDEISAQSIGQTNDDKLSSPKTYDIYNFYDLHSALTSDEYNQVTVNIKSNIKLTDNTNVSSSITSLIINGNKKTINGNNHHQFLIMKNTSLTLKNINIKNCGGTIGGAIVCEGNHVSITDCIFSNCNAYPTLDESYALKKGETLKAYGGAIYCSGNNITISDNIFEGNKVQAYYSAFKDLDLCGGAIYNCGNNVKITGNIFKRNSATNYNAIAYGGAVYNCGNNVTITSNEFDENEGDCGGAIFNNGNNSLISKNNFDYNSANTKGSAIYNSANHVSIESNTFKRNRNYGKEDNIIQTYKEDTEISANEYVYTKTSSAGTISNNGSAVKIKSNLIDDRDETIIIAPETLNYGKELVIILQDHNGELLSGLKVIVNLNGAKTYKTDVNGKIKIPTKGLTPGKYNLKIKFEGTKHYAKSSLNIELTVKKANPKIIAKSKAFKKKSSKKYHMTLKGSDGKALKKTKVTLKIAGKNYKAKTDSKGKATFNIKLSKKGKYRATIKSKGNRFYNNASKKVKIIIK